MSRLDAYLVEHGFYGNRRVAKEAILRGYVKVLGRTVLKPSAQVPEGRGQTGMPELPDALNPHEAHEAHDAHEAPNPHEAHEAPNPHEAHEAPNPHEAHKAHDSPNPADGSQRRPRCRFGASAGADMGVDTGSPSASTGVVSVGARSASMGTVNAGARNASASRNVVSADAISAGSRSAGADMGNASASTCVVSASIGTASAGEKSAGADTGNPSASAAPPLIEAVPITARYVSRGGDKLSSALDLFGIGVAGAVALDVGASTGGFTDCLLQRGAALVYAIDAGIGQLHEKLASDPRVRLLEKTNARHLPPRSIHGGQCDLAVIDVSFIPLEKILVPVSLQLRPGADIVCLVKPQFEVGPKNVGKNGVVRDRRLHESAVSQVERYAERAGLSPIGRAESPILGGDGNREFFIRLR